jgi:uncharacterized protein (DUF2147 family)
MSRLPKAFPAVLLFLFLCASVAGGADASAAGPQGVWLRDDGNARVEFAPCGDKLCATNLWIRDSSTGEEVGDKLVMTLQSKSPTTLVGTAYDRKRDRSYSLTITLGDGSMTTRGCIVAGLLCKQVNWTPVAQASR